MKNNKIAEDIHGYYKIHASIYDITRWTFLFGRARILRLLNNFTQPEHIVEVGCGTGHNLKHMVARWPETKITGIDMSAEMLEKARKKHPNNSNIQFLQSTYASGLLDEKKQPDVILFSYALTMFNPGWEEAIQSAVEDLAPSGYIAVVDFHDSSSGSFKNWMQKNHVKMEGHLLPVLESNFETAHLETKPAYGIWNYLLYVGQKK